MLSEMKYDGNPTSSCDSDENMDVDYYEGNATLLMKQYSLYLMKKYQTIIL